MVAPSFYLFTDVFRSTILVGLDYFGGETV